MKMRKTKNPATVRVSVKLYSFWCMATLYLPEAIDLIVNTPHFGWFCVFQHLIRMKIASVQTNNTWRLFQCLFFVPLFFFVIYLTNNWHLILFCRIKFPIRKVSGRICLSLPSLEVELGGSKDWYGWNIIMYKNGELHSLYSWTLWKLLIVWKKTSSKSCLELNSLRRSQWVSMSISH